MKRRKPASNIVVYAFIPDAVLPRRKIASFHVVRERQGAFTTNGVGGGCPNSARIREDSLTNVVKAKYSIVFDRAEDIIAGLCDAATEAAKGNKGEGERIKREITAAEKDQERLVELLMDRDISPATKQAINRKVGTVKAELATLRGALHGLREKADNNTEGLANIVRDVLEQAREHLDKTTTPTAFNAIIDRFVGPMVAKANGSVIQKKLPADESAGKSSQIGLVAGGGFEPPTSSYERL